MHDVVLVEFLESLQQLPEDDEGLGFLQELFLLQQSLQVALVAVLVHKIEIVRGL